MSHGDLEMAGDALALGLRRSALLEWINLLIGRESRWKEYVQCYLRR